MALTFNSVLVEYGINPKEVRLLRHHTGHYVGRTPYSLWRDDLPAFMKWQGIQSAKNRSRLTSRYWASFVATPWQSTLFVGLFEVAHPKPCAPGTIDPLRLALVSQNGAEADFFEQTPVEACSTFNGRISIDWGSATRVWIQRAQDQAKPVLEIARIFREDAFPGFNQFISNLSLIETLPGAWLSALRATRGIYLLTCPRTREQYVGSATGEGGFLGRWLSYVRDGHGGNVGLKSRDPSDYQVSILEVSGSSASVDDIIAAEQLWKKKLQSLEMGLNHN